MTPSLRLASGAYVAFVRYPTTNRIAVMFDQANVETTWRMTRSEALQFSHALQSAIADRIGSPADLGYEE